MQTEVYRPKESDIKHLLANRDSDRQKPEGEKRTEGFHRLSDLPFFL